MCLCYFKHLLKIILKSQCSIRPKIWSGGLVAYRKEIKPLCTNNIQDKSRYFHKGAGVHISQHIFVQLRFLTDISSTATGFEVLCTPAEITKKGRQVPPHPNCKLTMQHVSLRYALQQPVLQSDQWLTVS